MGAATGVRLTLKFNFNQEIRGCGWSESYDLGYADLPTAVASLAVISAFMTDRVQCLGSGPFLVTATLSAYVQPLAPGDAPVRRNTVSIPVPTFPLTGNAYNPYFGSDPDYSSDYATTDLYLNAQTSLSGTPVYHRNIWLAGLPDKATLTPQLNLNDVPTQAAVTKFLNDLTGTGTNLAAKIGVQLRSIDRSGANKIKPCTNWLFGPPVSFVVPAHGFVANQPIIAVGCTVDSGGTAPRGRYLVGTVIDANSFTLQGVTHVDVPVKTGGFKAAIVTFNAIKVVTQQGITKRDKGRPFGLSVGRRPKQRTVPA
jgi:hypothetical protein